MPYVQSLNGDDNDHLSTSVFSLMNISFSLRVILFNVSAVSIWYSYQFISFLLFSHNAFTKTEFLNSV